MTTANYNAVSKIIADYNTTVTTAANAAGLTVTGGWKVIGSTALVDAKDNTGTNTTGGANDVPIFKTDGVTKIADNNADLWDGSLDSQINCDENGDSKVAGRIWTGSFVSGTAGGANVLGNDTLAANGKYRVIIGNNNPSNATYWVNAYTYPRVSG